LMILLGLVYLFELSHVYDAIAAHSYYSGVYTSILLLCVGFFYWKELLKNHKIG